MKIQAGLKLGLCFLLLIFISLQIGFAEEGSKIYADNDYGYSLTPPAGWTQVDSATISIPGEFRRAWSPDGTSTIVVFVQHSNQAVTPSLLLEQSATGVKSKLAAQVKEQEVRQVAGIQAMWLVFTASGTGGAVGAGNVPTTQHWVAIPREKDVIVLLLTAPASNFEALSPAFQSMLQTLKVSSAPSAVAAATPSPAGASRATPGPEIRGTYQISGTNPNGEPYQGTLTVKDHGEAYEFYWLAGQKSEGVGIQRGTEVVVGFGGKQCGVVDYHVAPDGTLEGTWTDYGQRQTGSEQAKRTSAATDVAGVYELTGNNLNGIAYEGGLTVTQKGETYQFVWETGDLGVGIRLGDAIAVSFREAGSTTPCGVAAYHVLPDGTLDGKWSVIGLEKAGTE
jgi:hypothetical protein